MTMLEQLKEIFSKGSGPGGYYLPVMALTLPQFRQLEEEIELMKQQYEQRIEQLEDDLRHSNRLRNRD